MDVNRLPVIGLCVAAVLACGPPAAGPPASSATSSGSSSTASSTDTSDSETTSPSGATSGGERTNEQAGESGPPQPTGPLPTELAGFRMGMTVPEFDALCKTRGRLMKPLDDETGLRIHGCDGVEALPGIKVTMMMGFCEHDGRLCELAYYTKVDAIRAFTIVSPKYVAMLGPSPNENRTLASDQDLDRQCATTAGKVRRTWFWAKTLDDVHGRVLVAFRCGPGEPSEFSLFIDDPIAATAQVALFRHPH